MLCVPCAYMLCVPCAYMLCPLCVHDVRPLCIHVHMCVPCAYMLCVPCAYSSGQNKPDVFYNAVAVARCEYYSSSGVPFRVVLENIENLIDTLYVTTKSIFRHRAV